MKVTMKEKEAELAKLVSDKIEYHRRAKIGAMEFCRQAMEKNLQEVAMRRAADVYRFNLMAEFYGRLKEWKAADFLKHRSLLYSWVKQAQRELVKSGGIEPNVTASLVTELTDFLFEVGVILAK